MGRAISNTARWPYSSARIPGIPTACREPAAWLRDFSRDPARTLVVIDPVVSETAEFADIHLRVKPGTDAWLLAAMVAMLVQQGKYRGEWLAQHSTGLEQVLAAFAHIPVERYCAIAGLPVAQVQQAVDAIAMPARHTTRSCRPGLKRCPEAGVFHLRWRK